MKKLLLTLLCLPLSSFAMEESKALAKKINFDHKVYDTKPTFSTEFANNKIKMLTFNKRELEKKLNQVKKYKSDSSNSFLKAAACWTLLLCCSQGLIYGVGHEAANAGLRTGALLAFHNGITGTVQGSANYFKYLMSNEEDLTDEIAEYQHAITLLNENKIANNNDQNNSSYSALIKKQ